ncbi:MAG TPA: alpha-1,4-glucan--maltose-1-phosphate maltosyltransferase [Desulfuromonadaceae bacterium]|jgi:starch synthase (maltosyl-transferring)
MEGRNRVIIEAVSPQIDCGRYPVKRIAGEELVVQADIFCDGHDEISARLLYRQQGLVDWEQLPMQRLGNDRWQGSFSLTFAGLYQYTVTAWVDHFRSWQKDLLKKHQAGQNIEIELLIGIAYIEKGAKSSTGEESDRLQAISASLMKTRDLPKKVLLVSDPEIAFLLNAVSSSSLATTYHQELKVIVERQKALFSSWYELFPRSCAPEPGRHGTLKDCCGLLPEIAEMGFDVLYLPPIHPIGTSKRKGKSNSTQAKPGDPGSPWAIGNAEGGHKAVHPGLGTIDDLQVLIQEAKSYGVEVALDLAFQCSPDHPYLTQHPEWFLWRPDGSVQFAENPPKKYEDIIPLNFETDHWQELWDELKSVVFFWMDIGIRIFRVDNPHTKPFRFWEWLIQEAKQKSPDVLFLAEAFTRPKVMHELAKLGFSQSYTYFAWRSSKEELTSYLNELTHIEVREVMRPNFWPNTPDILPEHLQYGGRAAFVIRLVLAATLSSNYGIYGPAYELCVSEAVAGTEEYLNAEKYELKQWDRDQPGNLKTVIAAINRIRRENAALKETSNLKFYQSDNDSILFYGKSSPEQDNIILVAVCLDPFHTQAGRIRIPIADFGIEPDRPYLVHDLLNNEKLIWQGEWNRIKLDPEKLPARIFRIRAKLRREVDFEYYL